MSSRAKISSRLVRPVGFSKGWAEFALTMPPPLVPSSLMASWLAIGPPVDGLRRALHGGHVDRARGGLHDAQGDSTMARTSASGSRTRVTPRVRSTQKLPMVPARSRVKPRTRATATAMPTAAETKFCTVSPAIWTRWLIVDSPP